MRLLSSVRPSWLAAALPLPVFLLAWAEAPNPSAAPTPGGHPLLEARVYLAQDDARPVEGALMIVKTDPSSPKPFRGPRQSFRSDRAGWIRAEILGDLAAPARPVASRGWVGGPAAASPEASAGQVCVLFLFDGRFSVPHCGVTLPWNGAVRVGPVFAEDFASPPSEAAE